MDIGKDLQDAYEHGRQDALTELMEYTYGMLTSEKFGLQHKIKSMMADRCFRKTESDSENPNNCEDEPQTCDGNCWMKKQNGEWLCEHCQREPKTEPQTGRSE